MPPDAKSTRAAHIRRHIGSKLRNVLEFGRNRCDDHHAPATSHSEGENGSVKDNKDDDTSCDENVGGDIAAGGSQHEANPSTLKDLEPTIVLPKDKQLDVDVKEQVQACPEDKPTSKKKDYSQLIQTTYSLVTFILQGIKEIGSNLPGIGAVGVVLSAKEKLNLEASNREEVDELLKYIQQLCATAVPVEPMLHDNVPCLTLHDDLIEHLKRASANLETTKGRNRIIRTINAEAIKAELEAVWQGIDRSIKTFQLQATIKVDGLLNSVFRLILDEATKDEDRRINDVINRMAVAKGAKFDSFYTEQNRIESCSDGTREGVLASIQNWATSSDTHQKRIFWLNGLAGIGKSTIAMTIARWASAEERVLGGSFFFARDVEELSNSSMIFPTLAAQLAQFDVGYKRALYEVLFEDADIPFTNLQAQFDGLILKPLSASTAKRPVLIVLDALDECNSVEGVKKILEVLLHSNAYAGVPNSHNLRILITSRPEAHIRFMFTKQEGEGRHEKVILHDIDDNLAREDIRKYLEVEFAKLSSGTLDLPELPKDWPSVEEFNRLLDHCGKFFAYAATAVRFIGDEDVRDPVDQLREILRIQESANIEDGLNPYHDLDTLYLGVIGQVVSKNMPIKHVNRIRLVLGTIICLRDPMSLEDLAKFLSMTPDELHNALHRLHSVVVVKEVVRFFHQSFPDFIRDEERCTDKRFLVDVPAHEGFMTLQCIDVMRNHIGEDTLFISNYASQHWNSHARAGNHFEITHLRPPIKNEDSTYPESNLNIILSRVSRLRSSPQSNILRVNGVKRDLPGAWRIVCLSKETILDSGLLTLLEAINAETSGTMSDIIQSKALSNRNVKKNRLHRVRKFSDCTQKPEHLEFFWEDTRLSLQSSRDKLHGYFRLVCQFLKDNKRHYLHKLRCVTRNSNTVTVPTTLKNDCIIVINGTIHVSLEMLRTPSTTTNLSSSRESDNNRSLASIWITWSASIKFVVDDEGLKVYVPTYIVPTFHEDIDGMGSESLLQKFHQNLIQEVYEHFPRSIDFSPIYYKLKAIFEDCNPTMAEHEHDHTELTICKPPIFSRRGDLLLELGAPKDADTRALPGPNQAGFKFLGKVVDSSPAKNDIRIRKLVVSDRIGPTP